MGKINFTGFDQTKSTVSEAMQASALNPGKIYLTDSGSIVLNKKVYSKVIGAHLNGTAVPFNPNMPGVLDISVPTDFIPNAKKGVANGVATLDSTGKIPSNQLGSYIDQIINITTIIAYDDASAPGGTAFFKLGTPQEIVEQGYSAPEEYMATGEDGKLYVVFSPYMSSNYNRALVRKAGIHLFRFAIPESGYYGPVAESNKIYLATDTNIQYRCSDTTLAWVAEISQSLALGETASTAYRGDRGKAAYDAAVANLLTAIREYNAASDTAIASEKAIRLAIESHIVDYNHLDSALQGYADNVVGHISDSENHSFSPAPAKGLYKIKITDEGHISSEQYPTLVTKEDLTSLGVENASNKRNSIRAKELASSTEYPTEYAVAEIIAAVTEQISDTLSSISSRLNVVEEALHIDVDPYYGSGDGVFVGDIE